MMGKLEKMEADPHGAAEGRPGRYVHHGASPRRVFTPIIVWIGRDAVLFVRGRKSGRRLAVPMDQPFAWQGTRYLVSPLGDTHRARNLRAAGRPALPGPGRVWIGPCVAVPTVRDQGP